MTTNQNSGGIKLQMLGTGVLRYGLVVVLLWVGFLKFSEYEAKAVHDLASNSPLLSWLTNLMSVQSFSNLLGTIEIILGILIALRPFSSRESSYGSIGAIFMFLITLTFLFSTPGVWEPGYGAPYLSGKVGQFIAKDLLFLGAALYTAGEALIATRSVKMNFGEVNAGNVQML